MRHKVLICLFLTAAVFAIFWQTGNHDFINFDDPDYVTENPHVMTGVTLENFVWSFNAGYAANWHPLTWLSHMVDSQIYGLNPKGHHLSNVLLHAANAVLLFLLLTRMTGALWQSSFVAALFALHPLHVESVAWVAERKDVLSTFFWMLTLAGYAWYVERPGLKRYLITFLSFALGLMAKPMLVTLPVVMLIADYWPLRRFSFAEAGAGTHPDSNGYPVCAWGKSPDLRLFLEKLPFFALSIISGIVTIYAQHKMGAMAPLESNPFLFRVANASIAYVKYLGKMIWPQNLAAIYPLPPKLLLWHAVGAGLLMLALFIVTIRLARKQPYLLAGWLWYFITLIPVIGLIQVGKQQMADRYTYIPLIGIFIMIAWGVPALVTAGRYRNSVLAVAGGVIVSVCALATHQQIGYWKDSVTLFGHAVDVVKNNHDAHNILGLALYKEGKTDEALRHFSEARRISPNEATAYVNIGMVMAKQGRPDEAIRFCSEALRINPRNADAHHFMALALEEKGRFEEAVMHYTEALRLRPDRADIHMGMGSVLLKERKVDAAIRSYRRALEINPEVAEIQYNLGLALVEQGKVAEAMSHFARALRINPNLAEVHYNLGVALARLGRLDEGIVHFGEALRINPGLVQARQALEFARQLKMKGSNN